MTEIADKEDDPAELDSQLEDVRMDIAGEEDRLSAFGKERTGLRETLQSFAPSLPMFGAGKLRGKLSAAQSSIGSALSAMDSRAESEKTLREYGSRWRSLEAEYRANSNI